MTEERISYYTWLKRRNPAHAKRVAAVEKVYEAVKKGQLVRPDQCSRCHKAGRIQGHHADYDRPLEVEWLCVKCHAKEHRALRAAAEEARRARLRDPAHRIGGVYTK